MADEVIRGRIDMRELASKKVKALRRELELLGGKAAVKTQNEIKKLERDIGKLGGSTAKTTPLISRFTAGIAKGNLIAMAGQKAFSLLSDSIGKLGESVLIAARVETLNRVVTFTGQRAGNSAAEIGNFRDEIIGLGITQRASLEIMQRFLQAELDLADATKIARLAQDAATIAGVNSSEAALQMTDAINALRPRLLKTFGIMVNLNTVYREASQRLGKTADELTTFERKQALLNATLEQGKTIAGVYETAMETVGKRLTSLPRHFENVKVVIGQNFTGELLTGVDALTDFLKIIERVGSAAATPEVQDVNKWIGDFRGELVLLNPVMAESLGILDEYEKEVALAAEAAGEAKEPLEGLTIQEWGQNAAALALTAANTKLKHGWLGLVPGLLSFTAAAIDGGDAAREQAKQYRDVAAAIEEQKAALRITPVPTPPFLGGLIGPDAELLKPPEIITPDVAKIGEDFMETMNQGFDKMDAKAARARTSIKGIGEEAHDAGLAGAEGFNLAANSLAGFISMAQSGRFTFGGLLQMLSFIPGLQGLGVLGSVLPFDDPVNDSALVRETRRIGSFMAKGFAQSAAPDTEPRVMNITINAAKLTAREIAEEIKNLNETGLVTLGTVQ